MTVENPGDRRHVKLERTDEKSRQDGEETCPLVLTHKIQEGVVDKWKNEIRPVDETGNLKKKKKIRLFTPPIFNTTDVNLISPCLL